MIRVTIDVGGTFTDCLVLDEAGEIHEFKSETVPSDPAAGLIRVLEKAAAHFGLDLSRFMANVGLLIAHGTTLSTNALLTGKTARVGLLTTDGFRDTIQFRRGYKNIRTSRFNLFVQPYRALVPRHLMLPVRERILHNGEVTISLCEIGR